MTTRRWRSRTAALLAGGAFALHQLRYLAGYGDHSHRELAGQGHAYLTAVAPLVAVLIVLVAADFCIRLADARVAGRTASPPRLRALWAMAAVFLLAAYSLQESVEGALSAGHPGGAAGVLGHGGWVALPLAAGIGLAIALAVRGAHRAIELAAEPPARVRPPRLVLAPVSLVPHRHPTGRRMTRQPSARAPPVTSIP